MAIESLPGSQLWDRLLLLLTDPSRRAALLERGHAPYLETVPFRWAPRLPCQEPFGCAQRGSDAHPLPVCMPWRGFVRYTHFWPCNRPDAAGRTAPVSRACPSLVLLRTAWGAQVVPRPAQPIIGGCLISLPPPPPPLCSTIAWFTLFQLAYMLGVYGITWAGVAG